MTDVGTRFAPPDPDDVRPYWSEEPEILGEWSLHWTHVSELARAPIGDWLDQRIARFTQDGVCAMCMNDLDDGVCGTCGFNPSLPRRPEWTPEMKDDYIPRLPDQLLLEEYADAVIEPEAA